ncbi:MarR family winged helix-turn-helix transcriptional regulator [Georgenia ruanii]|uniref:MarR family transcriptional regulator n=1 Tax=Georgenia ruanii TaxID=348442 RepID=A0A7J9URX1_9MICO|nr:MarR family transcriptional regulator [Georgenia ruanii]MPV87262.1 MarR family transcriptional regulator [Georgenia ruanii]
MSEPQPDELLRLADQFRAVLRDAAFLMRSLDVDSGVSSSHLTMLNLLAAGPQRVNVVARHLGIKVPSATEQIIRLEKAGHVHRSPDPSDARAVLVRLSAAGDEVRARENRRRNEALAVELGRLPAADRDAIAAALRALERFDVSLGQSLRAGPGRERTTEAGTTER